MKTSFEGIVRGSTIELTEDAGLPDGQAVRVTLEPASGNGDAAGRESLGRAAGAWVEDAAELDRFLEWNRQQRKGGRPEVSE